MQHLTINAIIISLINAVALLLYTEVHSHTFVNARFAAIFSLIWIFKRNSAMVTLLYITGLPPITIQYFLPTSHPVNYGSHPSLLFSTFSSNLWSQLLSWLMLKKVWLCLIAYYTIYCIYYDELVNYERKFLRGLILQN